MKTFIIWLTIFLSTFFIGFEIGRIGIKILLGG